MKKLMKKFIKTIIRGRYGQSFLGYTDITMSSTLGNLKGILPEFKTVIDIGASDARWTKEIRELYPDCYSLMIEANRLHEVKLSEYVATHKNTSYEICVAGDEEGKVYFDDSDLFGGVASKDNQIGKQLCMNSIDNLVNKSGYPGKYLLKFDTHGFELPILAGAKEILKDTAIIVMEVYNFQIANNSLKFWEMCEYLDKIGFSPVGIADLLYREKDNALWQFDLILIPKVSSVFDSNQYD